MLRTFRHIRTLCYFSARIIGDIVAVASGPGAILRRLVRKALWRAVGNATRGL